MGERSSGTSVATVWESMVSHASEPCSTGWALFGLLAVSDPALAIHSVRGTFVSGALAASAGLELDRDAFWGFLLHDVGTLEVPSELLDQPGPLSSADREAIATHAMRSAHLLARDPDLVSAGPIALHHHERWDGTGYPDGLTASEIPLACRILTMGDAFAALTADRAHRAALRPEDAVEVVSEYAGTQFDPDLAAAFPGLTATLPAWLLSPPQTQAVLVRTGHLAEHADRARDLSGAQREALYTAALGLEASEAAHRLGRAPGTQRTWAASLRRALACPPRVPLRRFLITSGRRLYDALTRADVTVSTVGATGS